MITDIDDRYMVAYKEKMESGEVLWNDETNNFTIIESVQNVWHCNKGKMRI